MKIMKTKSFLFLVFSFVILAFSACSKQDTDFTQSKKAVYSGEELFRGIFLLDGDVADKIPSYMQNTLAIKRMTPEQKTQLSY